MNLKPIKNFLCRSVFAISLFTFSVIVHAENTLTFQVLGVPEAIATNITARLDAVKSSASVPLTANQIQMIYLKSTKEIQKATEPYGYFAPQIQSKLTRNRSSWTASYQIKLGAPILINHVDVTVSGAGKNNSKLITYLKKLPIQSGQVFQTENYNNVKTKLFEIANQQGYIKAYFADTQITINPEQHTANIVLHLETGPRFYFGDIRLEAPAFDRWFIYRFISFTQADAFSSQRLLTLQTKMTAQPYFQQVTITPLLNEIKDHHVPIAITITPPKSQKYNIGIGYGTFTGPRLLGGISLRHIDDAGSRLDGQVRLSAVLSGFAVKHFKPGKNPLTDQWIYGGNLQRFQPQNASSTALTFFYGYESKFSKINYSLYLNYLAERYRILIGDDNSKRTSFILYPSANLSFVKADNIITPRQGESVSFTMKGAARPALSSATFLQGDIKGKYIFMPLDFARVILRGEVGYTYAKHLENLPATLRFYAGELNGLRGFDDSSIGPGKYLKIGSVEYQNKIVGNLYGAVFYDMGFASDAWHAPINKGVGAGLVYDSMLGPIKAYVARPVNTANRHYSFEFSIGPEF